MNRTRAIVVIAVALIASILVYNYLATPKVLTGTITVSGAFALYPMMVKWAEEYEKVNPRVKVEISAGGAGKGMADALAGLVDIGMISREIQPAEVQRGAFFVAVVKDAVVAAVNIDNPVLAALLAKGVQRSILMNIYIYGNITTWGEVVGRPEITEPIHIYTRSDSCGAADTWGLYLGGHKQDDLNGVGVYGDPGIAEAVKNDRLGISYNNLNYAYDNKTKRPVEGLAVVPLDINQNGRVDPNEDFYETKDKLVQAIATGAYPSPPARLLYLVTKGKFTGIVKEFVKWILGDGQKYALETGYVPLSPKTLAEQLTKLEG